MFTTLPVYLKPYLYVYNPYLYIYNPTCIFTILPVYLQPFMYIYNPTCIFTALPVYLLPYLYINNLPVYLQPYMYIKDIVHCAQLQVVDDGAGLWAYYWWIMSKMWKSHNYVHYPEKLIINRNVRDKKLFIHLDEHFYINT